MKPSKYLFYCVVESVPFYCMPNTLTPSMPCDQKAPLYPNLHLERPSSNTYTMEKFHERVVKKIQRSKNGKVHPVSMLQFRKAEHIPPHTLCNHQGKLRKGFPPQVQCVHYSREAIRLTPERRTLRIAVLSHRSSVYKSHSPFYVWYNVLSCGCKHQHSNAESLEWHL